MKKAISLALITLATINVDAQCFTLRQVVSNNIIKCEPDPVLFPFGYFYKASMPYNTRKISWNSPVPVRAHYSVYGYLQDNPGTPSVNESTQMVHLEDKPIPPMAGATITTRFSTCDDMSASNYDTSSLREFVIQLVIYNTVTGAEISRGYMQWTR